MGRLTLLEGGIYEGVGDGVVIPVNIFGTLLEI